MSGPFTTSNAIAQAREWLDTAAPRWRLQTLQHRSRYNPRTGEYRQLPTRIRRFLNGTPAGIKSAVLQVLRESAPYKSPVFDLECDGLEYTPTNTFIRKDGAEHETNQRDATYTIIQDLRVSDGPLDRFGFADESSCSQLSESEYRWDEAEVEDCPDGSQGVSYQVSDVSRDRETDLFSYRLRKVVALTQHMPPSVSQCDARRRVTVETWNNVYGEPGSFRQDPVKGGSAPVVLPAPCSQPDGTSVQVSVSENADCTYRVEVTRVDAVLDEGQQFSAYRDQYKAQSSSRDLNARAPLDRRGVEVFRETVDGQLRGVMAKYESSRNEDGTWNNDVSREEERPVPSSTVEVRRTPRHAATVRVDTNVPDPASSLPEGARWGSYKYTRTPGGLFTNEYVSYERRATDSLGRQCSKTAFLHSHETLGTAASVASGHVPDASGGKRYSRVYETDAEGVVTRRDRVDEEITKTYAARRAARTLVGASSGFSHRSVGRSVADGLLASPPVGRSVEARLTEGAMWDVDVRDFSPVAGASLGFDCRKTVYQHVHEAVSSAASVGPEAQSAGGGHVRRVGYRVDPETGAVTRTDVDEAELHVPESRRSVRVTARGTVVRTTASNAASPPADAASPGTSTEFEVTPGGLYNVTRETTVPNAGGIGRQCSQDAFVHSDGTVRTQSSAPSGHAAGGSGGVYREVSGTLGDDGLWEVRETEHSERPVPRQRVEQRVTRSGLVKRITDMQVSGHAPPLSPSVTDVGRESLEETTRGGRFNVTRTEVVRLHGKTGTRCSDDAFLHSHVTVNAEESPSPEEAQSASNGVFRERSSSLNELGGWDVSETVNTEHNVSWRSRDYKDAFGETSVTEEASVTAASGTRGGRDYRKEQLVQSVESQMTKGRNYGVRTVKETPTFVESEWLKWDHKADKGLEHHYFMKVFRNAAWNKVEAYRDRVSAEAKTYHDNDGSCSFSPQFSVSPNKFGLWDGTVGLVTTWTPKAWSSGGNNRERNILRHRYKKVDVTYHALNSVTDLDYLKVLVATTTEYHEMGGGVDKDDLTGVLAGTLVAGSAFSYSPSGQAFQYDIITKRETKFRIVTASEGVSAP